MEPGPGRAARVTVGLDALGVDALGDVVYIQLADPGTTLLRGEAMGSLEAEKMIRPVLAPVSGLVTEVNLALRETPGLLNTDPYGRGWLVRLDAAAWEEERASLVTGPDIEAWVRAELAALGERG